MSTHIQDVAVLQRAQAGKLKDACLQIHHLLCSDFDISYLSREEQQSLPGMILSVGQANDRVGLSGTIDPLVQNLTTLITYEVGKPPRFTTSNTSTLSAEFHLNVAGILKEVADLFPDEFSSSDALRQHIKDIEPVLEKLIDKFNKLALFKDDSKNWEDVLTAATDDLVEYKTELEVKARQLQMLNDSSKEYLLLSSLVQQISYLLEDHAPIDLDSVKKFLLSPLREINQ